MQKKKRRRRRRRREGGRECTRGRKGSTSDD